MLGSVYMEDNMLEENGNDLDRLLEIMNIKVGK